MAKYLASDEEKRLFETLDLTGKRAFLEQFWSKRSRITGAPFTDSRKKYLRRVKAANQRFSNPQGPGWKTDRGRIFVTYGNPDDIERYPYSENLKPYSIWKYYQLEGGSDFVFYDRMGFGKYELIHSTHYKELQNPNWQNILRQ